MGDYTWEWKLKGGLTFSPPTHVTNFDTYLHFHWNTNLHVEEHTQDDYYIYNTQFRRSHRWIKGRCQIKRQEIVWCFTKHVRGGGPQTKLFPVFCCWIFLLLKHDLFTLKHDQKHYNFKPIKSSTKKTGGGWRGFVLLFDSFPNKNIFSTYFCICKLEIGCRQLLILFYSRAGYHKDAAKYKFWEV